ncbi:MAG TPA: hypothetical protein VHL11_12435 [Phototrophicaceae bacterium]|jgi:hypothetical protein|nr:hypothetical protein [Phototrophicaceae bacterium]
MNMSQRARQMLKQWAILFGLLIVLHLLLFGGWWILEPYTARSTTPTIVLMIVYLVLLAVILLIFFRRLSDAASPVEYREAQEQGLPATAKVLKIERTRWRVKRTRNFRLQTRPQRREYLMRVRVTRPGEADYEASLAEFLTGDQVPKQGAVIPIKIHPQHPQVIVMIHDQPSV